MVVPQGFNYGAISESSVLKGWLNEVVKEIEVDGYVIISKIHHFKDIDIACMDIRGKDPLMSTLKRCKVDSRILTPLYEIIHDKVSCNFEIKDGALYMPDIVGVENFNFIAPREELALGNPIESMPSTPMEVLWRLISGDYSIIVDGCAPVPCHKIYFGYDVFSANIDYVNKDGKKQTLHLMELNGGMYQYMRFNVISTKVAVAKSVDYLLDSLPTVTVCDDLGRQRQAMQVDLKIYEKYVYNQRRFNKLYERNYTLTVLTRMYKMATYLDGIGLILRELGVDCQKYSIPHRSQQSFSLNTDKQHNIFSIQMTGYDPDIISQVVTVYKEHMDVMKEYLKTKDELLRNRIVNIFTAECSTKFGQLIHYFVNGMLDALAIQKGDVAVRRKILTGYYTTVRKEFLMYGCYYYDIRTAFLRNNFIIDREFMDTFVVNEYNGQYFLVG